ncbi:MAG: carbon starvation protein A [Candidatus Glassbacteria bacterium]
MDTGVFLIIGCVLFAIAYIFYGGYLTRRLKLSRDRQTPAHVMNDGLDYCPARRPVLMGHHFASIAGAGPIVGPVFAAAFGWLPVLLWIIIGSIFFGAVHDFTSLVASVRHRGKSIGEVIESYIGLRGKRLFLIFSWSALILVIAVFAIVVAQTFVKYPQAGTASIGFVILAIAFGFIVYRKRAPLAVTSIAGVCLLFLCIYLGILFPLELPYSSWIAILFLYIFIASVTPVWILLQPRDYLNSFLLYLLIIFSFIGILIARPEAHFPALTSFHTELGYLFPIVFVTVACGAISGFHCLVASGTTAKQLDRESDAKPVGYGSMLIEGVLAIIALIAAIVLTREGYAAFFEKGGGGPISLFANGVGGFISALGVPESFGVTFTALALSAFALTSLDTCTRLARFAFQEFFEDRDKEQSRLLSRNRFVGTAVTIAAALLLTVSGEAMQIWPIFGSANQLLAALALLAVSVWLARKGTGNLFVLVPMYFMFVVTLSSLVILFYSHASALISGDFSFGHLSLAILSLILTAVAAILFTESRRGLSVTAEVKAGETLKV